MRSVRDYILVVILAAVGLAAWWLQEEREASPRRAETEGRRPDYTVEGLVASVTDESGRLHRRLTAREARHYPDGSGGELDEPRLTIFSEEAPPWIIRSDDGWVSEDGDELLLRGPVFIDRAADADARPIHIKTWDLYVKPEDSYAQTDQPVRLTSRSDWLSSSEGARVWFGEDLRLILLGRTRAQIAVR